MKQHEREYFIAAIRSGICTIRHKGLVLRIHQPNLEESLEACHVYSNSYDMAYADGVMDEDEMLEWMTSKELWSTGDDNRIEGLEKDIENLKVEIYKSRNNETVKERVRLYIRAGEKQLQQMFFSKHRYRENTCEGMAERAKGEWIVRNCTTLNGKQFNFEAVSLEYILSSFREDSLSESKIRELARNEPWKCLWTVHDSAGVKLFVSQDRGLTLNQNNLVIWSKMYDNIQESMDCPNDAVIHDDDMLDGWFVLQRKQREKEKAEAEFEDSIKSDKIKNSPEVFVMADTNQDKDRVNIMNSVGGVMTIKQREAVMRRNEESGTTQQGEFMDEKLKVNRNSNTMFKGKFGG